MYNMYISQSQQTPRNPIPNNRPKIHTLLWLFIFAARPENTVPLKVPLPVSVPVALAAVVSVFVAKPPADRIIPPILTDDEVTDDEVVAPIKSTGATALVWGEAKVVVAVASVWVMDPSRTTKALFAASERVVPEIVNAPPGTRV
jgi:hypothetical protein